MELPNRDLFAAWYAGSYEKAKDVAILCSRLPYNSTVWTKPEVLADTQDKSEGNPVLFVDRKKILWLFYVTMYGSEWTTCKIKCKRSTDNGFTWEPTLILRDELGWMTKNKPITLRNDDILLPIYDEIRETSMMMISENGGGTWRVSSSIARTQQPTIVQLSDGRLLAYLRPWRKWGYILKSVSYDNGRTWSPTHTNLPSRTPLKNPNSGIDMVRLLDGSIVLAFNDSFHSRTPLNVALSTDEGDTWPYIRTLETIKGEFSYPAIIQTHDGKIHITYTNDRVNIKHVVMNKDWILGRD